MINRRLRDVGCIAACAMEVFTIRKCRPPTGDRADQQEKTMSQIIKLAPSGFQGQRLSLGEMFDVIKRVWTEKAARRMPRPLQDVDGWSDQAEVAFYEDCRLTRCG